MTRDAGSSDEVRDGRGLLVVQPGTCATVQDRGRFGYRDRGVPVSGAFDRGSFELANALLGNPPEAAALEVTLVGGMYEAQVPLALALAGAPMEARIVRSDGREQALRLPQSVSLGEGDRLVLGGASAGARTYVAVRGGWRTPPLLGSRSSEARLQPGDVVPAEPGSTLARRPVEAPFAHPGHGPIRIMAGPDPIDPGLLESQTFRVGPQSDRMGLRLESDPLEITTPPERLSAPVAPGAVQVAGGRLIVLGVACGTIGGYPHVAHVIAADLDRLGQARPGDAIRWRWIGWDEARQIDRTERRARARRLLLIRAAAGAIAPHR